MKLTDVPGHEWEITRMVSPADSAKVVLLEQQLTNFAIKEYDHPMSCPRQW